MSAEICPTCKHEMECVMTSSEYGDALMWCPRCGTQYISASDDPKPEVHVPQLAVIIDNAGSITLIDENGKETWI